MQASISNPPAFAGVQSGGRKVEREFVSVLNRWRQVWSRVWATAKDLEAGRLDTCSVGYLVASSYEGSNARVVAWGDPPPMEAGAPMPASRRSGDSAFIAYVCRNPDFPGWGGDAPSDHPGFDCYSAVLRFDGVLSWYLGPPGDEALHLHPLYPEGLAPYSFQEVLDSPCAVDGLRHWILTFHDEMIEVVARSGCVLCGRVEGEDTREIVDLAAGWTARG